MVSTFHGLELGKRGLYAGQNGIATTGHNIANANTKGYSRQQVHLTTSPAVDVWSTGEVNPSQLGSGVLVESISRVRDRFLDQQYREQSATVGEWSVKQDTLESLESIINEPSETGLSSVMDQFWGAWQDLANETDSLSARSVIKERAQEFVDTAQSIDRSMTQLKSDLSNQVSAKINEANGYLKQIAELNNSIRRVGPQANDLLDQRNLAIEELSKLVSINVEEQSNGMTNISLSSDGTSLVVGANLGTSITGQSNISGGEIFGTKESMKIVDNYQVKLNEMVKGFVYGAMTVEVPAGSTLADGTSVPADQSMQITVNGINGLHQLGWSVREDDNGNVLPGAALFNGDEENFTIAALAVNPVIKEDIGLISASLRSETVNGQQKLIGGNADLAQLISKMRDHAVTIDGKSEKLNRFFQSVVSELGAESQAANRSMTNFDASLQATENRRQSVTGVSLDEEMANLIKYQHSYNAAARIVSTTDQMLDTIINRMAAR